MIVNGVPWFDTTGRRISAQAVGLLKDDGWYWMYGEDHALGEGNQTGIRCYRSRDLEQWEDMGVCLPAGTMPPEVRGQGGRCERPKVIRVRATGAYVMWMHLDNARYDLASAGVAIADRPQGPFTFVTHRRPIIWDYEDPRGRPHEAHLCERTLGGTFRDMALFQDDDGTAYVFYASESNATMYASRLRDDALDVVRPAVMGTTWQRILPFAYREAPAPFKHRGRYYLVTSGLTGWTPNPAEWAVADHPLGPWTRHGNPCLNPEAGTTFRAQPTYVLPIAGAGGSVETGAGTGDEFILLCDRWDGANLEKSTHVWIPFRMRADGNLRLLNVDRFEPTIFATRGVPPPVQGLAINGRRLTWHPAPSAAGYKVLRNGKVIASTTTTAAEVPPELAGTAVAYSVAALSLSGEAAAPTENLVVGPAPPADIWLSEVAADQWSQGFGYPEMDRAINMSPICIAGREFARGIGTHAVSRLLYRIGGRYRRFTALVGADWYPHYHDSTAVFFAVELDGCEVFRSGIRHVKDPALAVEVDVTGAGELVLHVGDGGGGAQWNHANWAEARLWA